MQKSIGHIGIAVLLGVALISVPPARAEDEYKFKETNELVSLVRKAAALVEKQGDAAFPEFKVKGGKWWHDELYIFVLDTEGNMLVHSDPELEGKNQLNLTDINGKPIVRWLINETTSYPFKDEGWSHYLWPKPGDIFPTWKSTFVKAVTAPSGKKYIVGAGLYNMKMEKKFVSDEVDEAVSLIEATGKEAFNLLRSPSGGFRYKDTYVFVTDRNGTELVNPIFPNLEGRNLMDLVDAEGRYLVRNMLELVEKEDGGWTYYLWPKPGESIPSKKHAFVKKARLGDSWVLVGSGVYFDR